MKHVFDVQNWLSQQGYTSEITPGGLLAWPSQYRDSSHASTFKRLGKFPVKEQRANLAEIRRWAKGN
jgi:hypothetical protein